MADAPVSFRRERIEASPQRMEWSRRPPRSGGWSTTAASATHSGRRHPSRYKISLRRFSSSYCLLCSKCEPCVKKLENALDWTCHPNLCFDGTKQEPTNEGTLKIYRWYLLRQ